MLNSAHKKWVVKFEKLNFLHLLTSFYSSCLDIVFAGSFVFVQIKNAVVKSTVLAF